MLFKLGKLTITPGALDKLTENEVLLPTLIKRHAFGDWGDLDEHDKKQNQIAIRKGFRILSSYPLPKGGKVWVITEADRSVTTILLPSEY